jgi:S-(hydroxymethyl)glutathione dehydrogenase / alcohol dehydrogenase
MRAAVLTGHGQPFDIREDIELAAPGRGEVRVRLVTSGVCGSDLTQWADEYTPIPSVLGHEAAGVVAEVGDDVADLAVGDRVLLAFLPACRVCPECQSGHPNLCRAGNEWKAAGTSPSAPPRLTCRGERIYSIVLGAFAEEVLVRAEAAIRLPDDMPFDVAALLGCGVLTGTGAVFNTASVTPGSSVAVLGCGGVGLSAIQAARISGASVILALDPVVARQEAALRAGATHAGPPGQLNSLAAELTSGDGFDYVFEVSGKAFNEAFDCTRKGGSLIPVGVGPYEVSLNMIHLTLMERKVLGCFYGGADPLRDYPRLFDLWAKGQLDVGSLITGRIELDALNDAYAQLRRGEGVRTIIEFG